MPPSPTWRARGFRLARRAAATAVDYVVICAPLALAGVLQTRRSRSAFPADRARVVVALTLTMPIACGLAAAEAAGGSPGKRLFRLRVRTLHDESPAPFSAALLRTAVKTAVPREIGHQAVWDLRGGPASRRRGVLLAVCAYATVAAQAAMICVGSGRTYADRLAGTVVADTTRDGTRPGKIAGQRTNLRWIAGRLCARPT